jgi:hypothetical protein
MTWCYEWQLCVKMGAAYVPETLVIICKTTCIIGDVSTVRVKTEFRENSTRSHDVICGTLILKVNSMPASLTLVVDYQTARCHSTDVIL